MKASQDFPCINKKKICLLIATMFWPTSFSRTLPTAWMNKHTTYAWPFSLCRSLFVVRPEVKTSKLCIRCNIKCWFSADFHSGLVARNRKPIECMLKSLLGKCKQYQIVCKKAKGWSCSFQLWHPCLLGCECLSKSYSKTREMVTAHTLVGVQHLGWTSVI